MAAATVMASMSMSMSMSSLAFATGAARAVRLPASALALAPRRRAMAVVVRAQQQGEGVEPPTTAEETTTKAASTAFSSSSSPSSSPTTTAPAAAKKKAASPGLWDALAFSGPAPERINGRLAMVGFVSALGVEAARGDGLLSQAGSGSGLAWFAATAAVLSVASLVPVLRGESAEARSGGVMSADAELWNGRFAMLGLVALAVTEYITGAPFVNV